MNNKISPCLWFDKDLPKAIAYYKKIFKNNLEVIYLGKEEDGPGGKYQFATIKLFGKNYDLLAAGPMFKFTEAISLTVRCKDQKEVDYYWNAFTKEGGGSVCGWCKDKYGLSWQVTPTILYKLSTSKDKKKRDYAMNKMFGMRKIVVRDLVG
jgi:predicted 3-demethylubiquinone-9 3-methyltransferase (glyoxalase superfamily)